MRNADYIKGTAATNEFLIRTVKKMKDSYHKLSSNVDKVNLSSGNLQSELERLKNFEKSVKMQLENMNRSTQKMDSDIDKIKTALKNKSDNRAIQNLKNNQIMITRAIYEIQKGGQVFVEHLGKFEKRMGQIWTALRYGHKRRKLFNLKLKAIEKFIRSSKNAPIIPANFTGDQMTKELFMKYDELTKLQSTLMKTLETTKKTTKHDGG